MGRLTRAAAVLALFAMGLPASAGHHHGTQQGHLPPSVKNMELVGRLQLTTVEQGVGDVSALGTTAYLAAYAPQCYARTTLPPALAQQLPPGLEVPPEVERQAFPGGGVWAVDITVPQVPVRAGFISAGENTYVGEGVQALHIDTPKFDGDVLLMSHESCDYRKSANGGISMYDVTDPRNPVKLVAGAGDRTPRPRGNTTAHQSHSAMAWDAGKKAYAVLVDNEEPGFRDVDIMDITNPRKPRMIAETGLVSWRGVNDRNPASLGFFGASFLHDMWVKKIDGHWMMLLSYWDSGWVLLNVDNPAKPRFVRDSDYPLKDPYTRGEPEGNGHQGTWSGDNRFVIGTNEDFFAKYTFASAGKGKTSQYVPTSELFWATPVAKKYGVLNGPTVYGGDGCALFGVPPASSLNVKPFEQATVILVDGICSYADKIQAAQRAGYDAAIIAASHDGSLFGVEPYRYDCAKPNEAGFTVSIPVLCIGHATFHSLLKTKAAYVDPVSGEPQVGKRGLSWRVLTFFDGAWGDMRLLNARTFKQIDQYAIAEARKEKYAEAFGALTVHEVKVDPRSRVNLAYASWYAGGARVLSFGPKGFKEVGHFIDQDGNNFWGTYPLAQPGAPPLLLFSDMNYGLYILRYTGPQ